MTQKRGRPKGSKTNKIPQYKLMNDNWVLSTADRYRRRFDTGGDVNIFGCINFLLIITLSDRIDKINKIKIKEVINERNKFHNQ